jgi:hypothetical protein
MTRSIKLELLREGPAHNHLLSPLTPYLALCGNHDIETLRVPYEHHQLVEQLRLLNGPDPQTAAAALLGLQDAMGRMLGKLRGLLAEVNAVPHGSSSSSASSSRRRSWRCSPSS